jgi:uncharacterized membrane protein (DUF2068 family)
MTETPTTVESSPRKTKTRAPTLYAIVAIKLAKGLLLLLLGLGVYTLSDNNLPQEFRSLLEFFHLDPEKRFFSELAGKIGQITPSNVIWVARGTLFYSAFSLVEGVGLLFRITWAGWLAIGESLFFIPIEIHELLRHFSYAVLVILGINILIVWYLVQNRHRLFRHHH